jgi:hypothetical protein
MIIAGPSLPPASAIEQDMRSNFSDFRSSIQNYNINRDRRLLILIVIAGCDADWTAEISVKKVRKRQIVSNDFLGSMTRNCAKLAKHT